MQMRPMYMYYPISGELYPNLDDASLALENIQEAAKMATKNIYSHVYPS